MTKTDKVGFHFDNSKDNLMLNLTQETQDKTSSGNWAKLVFRLDTRKKWSNKENDISGKLGKCNKICSNFQQMYAVMRNPDQPITQPGASDWVSGVCLMHDIQHNQHQLIKSDHPTDKTSIKRKTT